MSKLKKVLVAFGVLLIVVVAIPLVLFGSSLVLYRVGLLRDRRFMLKQVNHGAVASACLDLLTKPQYGSLLGLSVNGDDPRLPTAIREIKPCDVGISSNSVLIMKTGGFYHMGFIFRPSSTESNLYELVFREESDLDHDTGLYLIRNTNW